MKTVVITGASTGIGRSAAQYLAARGWTVFAGVRKRADGEAFDGAPGDLRPLMLDVTDAGSLAAAVETVSTALDGRTLGGLVNNAGIAEMGPLTIQPIDTVRRHFDVNLFGALACSQQFAPLLGMDRERTGAPGRIVNITSVGGVIASPFLGAYTATKHALESVTDTLRRELMIYGIDAIAVGPGAVRTPIWDKAEKANAGAPYQDSDWADSIAKFAETMQEGGRTGLDPDTVAAVIETALSARKPKARYAPVPDKLTNWTIARRLPKRWLDRVFAGRFGLTQDKTS